MRLLMFPAVAALALSASGAGAQVTDSTATAALAAAAPAAPAPVTLQDFTASLNVAVPSGRLVRTPTSPVALLLQRIDAIRRRGTPDTRSLTAPAGGAVPMCPMPVARIDTTALAPMPVVAPTGDLPIAGQLKGCDNPLRSR